MNSGAGCDIHPRASDNCAKRTGMNSRAQCRRTPPFLALAALVAALLCPPAKARAQQTANASDPATALTAALSAACRADQNQFANYLTADNATAFRALPPEQRTALLKRFSLADGVGKPLLSSNSNNPVLRCEAPEVTVEFRFGDTRTRDNLAFVPVSVTSGEQTEFGLVRENGAWRLLSLGLVLLDLPQLSKQWSEEELASHESAAQEALRSIAGAVEIYRHAFDHMPTSLSQMGPAPFNQVSPEQAALIDEGLAGGAENGYKFSYHVLAGAPPARAAHPAGTGAAGASSPHPSTGSASASATDSDGNFEVSATPLAYGKTGRRSFLLDASGNIHAADHSGAAATADDPTVENEKNASESRP